MRQGAPLSARELPALLARVCEALEERREVLDALNVFPVPDGDTGTNMTLTVRAALEALEAVQPASGAEASRAVVRGALHGARGNSGVILSQVLRAVVEVVTGHARLDARLYADALTRARDLAYEAVAEPVEGTILTAIAAAGRAAADALDRGGDLVAVSAAACEATAAAVERTPEELDVLRDAGVVDAGARGFEVVLAAVHGHLTGESPPVRRDPLPRTRVAGPAGCRADLAFPFEVQYLLDADDAVAAPLREELETIGDSVAVVAAGGLLNVHVHTADAGRAIEAGLAHGHPSRIEVVHLGDQVEALRGPRPDGLRERVPLRVVAVLDGAGAAALARHAGADVVPGRSGSLPSVADLAAAVRGSGAERVLLLPGHPNAVPAAHQAAALTSADGGPHVEVVEPADSPPSVLAALAVTDPGADPAQAVADAQAAAVAVRTGSVVDAVRDADTPAGPVREGQALATVGGAVTACADHFDALGRVCDLLAVEDAEVVTLLVGADVDADERDRAVALVRGRTGAEVEVIDAGQRPARYWVGAE